MSYEDSMYHGTAAFLPDSLFQQWEEDFGSDPQYWEFDSYYIGPRERRQIEHVTFRDVILRNTQIKPELVPQDPFALQ